MTVEEMKTTAKRTKKKDVLDDDIVKLHKDIVFTEELLLKIEAYCREIRAASYNEGIRRGMSKLLDLRSYLLNDPDMELILVNKEGQAVAKGRLDAYTK